VLGEFVEIGIGEANAGPVDVENDEPSSERSPAQRPMSPTRCAGSAAQASGATRDACLQVNHSRAVATASATRVGRVGDPSQMCRQPVLKPTGGMHGGRDEQGVGCWGNTGRRSALVTPSVRATSAMEKSAPCAIDGLARGIENPGDRFPRRSRGAEPDQPWGAHDGIVRQPR